MSSPSCENDVATSPRGLDTIPDGAQLDEEYRDPLIRRSYEFSDALITAVSAYPCLYATDDPLYRDADAKNDCWKEIAERLSSSGKECKRRFRNLKDVYMRVRKQLHSSDRKRVKWVYFNLMHSLFAPYINVKTEDEYEPLLEVNESELKPTSTTQNLVDVNSLLEVEANHLDVPHKKVKKVAAAKRRKNPSCPFNNDSKKKRVENSSQILTPSIPTEGNTRTPPSTETMLWAQSIAMRMEKLSVQQRAQLRIKVETLVMEAEINTDSKSAILHMTKSGILSHLQASD